MALGQICYCLNRLQLSQPLIILPVSANTADTSQGWETAQLGKHVLCNCKGLSSSCRIYIQSQSW